MLYVELDMRRFRLIANVVCVAALLGDTASADANESSIPRSPMDLIGDEQFARLESGASVARERAGPRSFAMQSRPTVSHGAREADSRSSYPPRSGADFWLAGVLAAMLITYQLRRKHRFLRPRPFQL